MDPDLKSGWTDDHDHSPSTRKPPVHPSPGGVLIVDHIPSTRETGVCEPNQFCAQLRLRVVNPKPCTGKADTLNYCLLQCSTFQFLFSIVSP